MNEQECIERMVAPGTRRPGKYREGVIQIHVTRACDQSCFGCTQGSNLGGKPGMISPDQFAQACKSLQGYFGVVGVFGGNPAMHPQFELLCEILRAHFPYEQRGLWCNNPINESKAQAMRATFDPAVSNLNVHMDQASLDRFYAWWPEARPFGLDRDSRHSPVYVSMKDLRIDESRRYELISRCDINQHWSAMMGVFRGELRAWFCEIAGAQSILRQDDPDYPDTGIDLSKLPSTYQWWQLPMQAFAHQVEKHCHDCGVPLRGYGELAVSNPDGIEQTSAAWEPVFRPKKPSRRVALVTQEDQLRSQFLARMTDYLGNSRR